MKRLAQRTWHAGALIAGVLAASALALRSDGLGSSHERRSPL